MQLPPGTQQPPARLPFLGSVGQAASSSRYGRVAPVGGWAQGGERFQHHRSVAPGRAAPALGAASLRFI